MKRPVESVAAEGKVVPERFEAVEDGFPVVVRVPAAMFQQLLEGVQAGDHGLLVALLLAQFQVRVGHGVRRGVVAHGTGAVFALRHLGRRRALDQRPQRLHLFLSTNQINKKAQNDHFPFSLDFTRNSPLRRVVHYGMDFTESFGFTEFSLDFYRVYLGSAPC